MTGIALRSLQKRCSRLFAPIVVLLALIAIVIGEAVWGWLLSQLMISCHQFSPLLWVDLLIGLTAVMRGAVWLFDLGDYESD